MLRRSVLAVTALVLAAPASAMQSTTPREAVAAQPAPASLPGTSSDRTSPHPQHDKVQAELEALFPAPAIAKRVGGRTQIECIGQADGNLGGCVLLYECPTGLGFGEAALKSARYFRMRVRIINGQPVFGGKVIVPMAWKMKGLEPPAECEPPPRSPKP
jgi:protein TonB